MKRRRTNDKIAEQAHECRLVELRDILMDRLSAKIRS